jgi:DNA-binding transcriptional LysR family regulator
MIARRAAHGGEGPLRIGVGYCMNHGQTSEAVSRFNDRFPRVRVEVQTMAVPLQFAALRSQTLDVGFVRPPIAEAVLSNETLISEPLFAALPRTHRLAARHRISLAALANEPFVLPPRHVVPVYHDIVLKACRDAGFVPHSPHEADQLPMLLAMVTGGSGVALVPAFARRLKPPGVAFLSLGPSAPNIDLAIAWRRDDTSRMVTEFIRLARQRLAQRTSAGGGGTAPSEHGRAPIPARPRRRRAAGRARRRGATRGDQ